MSRRTASRLISFLASPYSGSQSPASIRPALSTLRRAPQQQQPSSPASSSASIPASSPPKTIPASASRVSSAGGAEPPAIRDLTDGLADPLPTITDQNDSDGQRVDWTRSFHGLSSTPFTPEQAAVLQQEISADDIEIKPDGIIYLPEIKYRRILNKAFGPGGWGLAPRGETIVTGKVVTREYGLVCGGRLVSVARGEQQYFDPDGIPTATEGCKSNALMRCCKDLGIASELWDPRYIRKFMATNANEVMVEHAMTKKRRRHWMRKDDEVRYPWKVVPVPGSGSTASASAATAAAKKS